jgi:hypothetical protein
LTSVNSFRNDRLWALRERRGERCLSPGLPKASAATAKHRVNDQGIDVLTLDLNRRSAGVVAAARAPPYDSSASLHRPEETD